MRDDCDELLAQLTDGELGRHVAADPDDPEQAAILGVDVLSTFATCWGVDGFGAGPQHILGALRLRGLEQLAPLCA